jgi:hypothetical protein
MPGKAGDLDPSEPQLTPFYSGNKETEAQKDELTL